MTLKGQQRPSAPIPRPPVECFEGWWSLLLVAGLSLGLVGFSSTSSFDLAGEDGGGGGFTFTGSPISHAMTCATCHTGGGDLLKVQVQTKPARLLEDGYIPGRLYDIYVQLVDESHGVQRNGYCQPDSKGCNRNLFVAEFLGENGFPAGVLCPNGGSLQGYNCTTESGKWTSLLADGGAIAGHSMKSPDFCDQEGADPNDCIDLAALEAAGASQEAIDQIIVSQVRGSTSWRFSWRAPTSVDEPLNFYLGLVDGNAGATKVLGSRGYHGDSVVMASHVIPPVTASPAISAATGCSSSHSSPRAFLLLFALSVVMLRRIL